MATQELGQAGLGHRIATLNNGLANGLIADAGQAFFIKEYILMLSLETAKPTGTTKPVLIKLQSSKSGNS